MIAYHNSFGQVYKRVLCKTRVNRTTTHNGVIPEDEVWVKIGGDKGGGTMKLNFQICNVKAPNSTQNTCVFAMFEAPDSATNVHLVLERYNHQVSQLASAQWRCMYACTCTCTCIIYVHVYIHNVALLTHIEGKDSASFPAVTISFCAFSTEFLVLLVCTCICTTKSEMNIHTHVQESTAACGVRYHRWH